MQRGSSHKDAEVGLPHVQGTESTSIETLQLSLFGTVHTVLIHRKTLLAKTIYNLLQKPWNARKNIVQLVIAITHTDYNSALLQCLNSLLKLDSQDTLR